jgi:hypothetical protein
VQLQEVTKDGMQNAPMLRAALVAAFGPSVVENPVVSPLPLGSISKVRLGRLPRVQPLNQ